MNFSCLIPLIAFVLGGCISTNTPGDLSLMSVQAVDWQDQAEMPGPGASPAIGMVKDSEIVRMGQSVIGGKKPHRLILKIVFSSATNLSKFAADHSYNLGSDAYFCNHPKKGIGLVFPDIYWNGLRLGPLEADPIQRNTNETGAPIEYYFFINVARKKVVPSIPPQEGFDLWQKPEDICFYLAGGNGSGFGYKSNVAVIPKDMIAAALKNAPARFGGSEN